MIVNKTITMPKSCPGTIFDKNIKKSNIGLVKKFNINQFLPG